MAAAKGRLEKCYDFELMEHSGHLRGWLLDETEVDRVAAALRAKPSTVQTWLLRARERLRRELTDETEEEDPGYVRQQIVP